VAERRIVTYGDPVLRETSEPVDEINQEVKDLVSDLTAVDLTETLRVFINPEIVETSGEVEMEEGCLSFPGIYRKIVRPSHVRVRATSLDGNEFEIAASGLAARAVLHEYDHLEGKLFIDRMSSITRTLLKGRLRKLARDSRAA
jgi:peptide deformylase